ncbi:MAG: hypothetical protein QME52_14510, partial [Bacteroidota bacterium]|nr:hypothetical protein [Bacteroidota bacterium]
MPNGLPDAPPTCLEFDSAHERLILGSMRIYGSSIGGGLWYSTDQGLNWTLFGTDTTRAGIDTLGIFSMIIKQDTFFIGTAKGIFKSTDNGIRWSFTGLSNIGILSLAINDNGHIFAGTGSGGFGCYRSTDNGLTWSLKLDLGENHRVFITIANSGTIFVADLDQDGIYRSTDNGDSWQSVNNGLLTDLPNGKNVRLVAINSAGTLFAGTTTDGIFKSTDNGDNWTEIGVPTKIKTIITKNN